MKLSVQERHKGKKNKMEKKRIILASGSPRRKELLLQIGIVPEIIVSHVEEKITSDEPSGVVMSLAEQKAVDVAEDMPEGAVVLGSDTVVAADGKILGKPTGTASSAGTRPDNLSCFLSMKHTRKKWQKLPNYWIKPPN